MPEEVKGKRCFHQAERVLRQDRAGRNVDLRIVWRGIGKLVETGKRRGKRLRVSRGRRRMLIFSAQIQGEAAELIQGGEPCLCIEPRLIGTAIIVHDRLPKMVTVAKGVPRRCPSNAYIKPAARIPSRAGRWAGFRLADIP